MGSERWLKKAEPARNVSQSDVRRIQLEKERQRLEIVPAAESSPVTGESPSAHASPITDDRASMSASPITDDSPSKSEALALPLESPSTHASPVTHDTPKAPTVPSTGNYRKGDSRINNDFFDARLCNIDPLALALYVNLNRYRDGGSNLTVVVSWKKLSERIPVSESTLRRAYKQLNRFGLVFKEREVFAKSGAQGIVFRVVTGESPSRSGSPSTGDTHKRKDQKDNLKKEVASPSFQNCPDCNGSGFWYPNGTEKGVARCSHSKLNHERPQTHSE
jgi:hypothetical protein